MNIPIPSNGILADLPPRDVRGLSSSLEPVHLKLGEILYSPGDAIRHVYFPTSGVISVVVTTSGGSVEAGMVGREGVAGLWGALGAVTSPVELVVQYPVDALRTSAEAFNTAVDRSSALRNLLWRYGDAFLTMVSQSVACNCLHTAEQRLCRWLLMTHDRAGVDEFPLTQKFLGRMLGVRRMSITGPARRLQAAGLIRYVRGQIQVVNRVGLEAAACVCYRVVRTRFDDL